MKDKTKVHSFSIKVKVVNALKMRALELSIKTGKKVTQSELIELGLSKLGIK